MELLTELSQMEGDETVAAITKLMRDEKDDRVRGEARVLVGFMRAGAPLPPPTTRATTQPRND